MVARLQSCSLVHDKVRETGRYSPKQSGITFSVSGARGKVVGETAEGISKTSTPKINEGFVLSFIHTVQHVTFLLLLKYNKVGTDNTNAVIILKTEVRSTGWCSTRTSGRSLF